MRARRKGVVVAHFGKAALRRRHRLVDLLRLASGTVPLCSPVAGLNTGAVAAALAGHELAVDEVLDLRSA